jgi:alkyl hydroperoxide reductase subunit AhpC
LAQLRQQEEELDSLGVQVVVVTFGRGTAAREYVRDTNLEWPLLVDPTRELYSAYGMEHGSFWNVYGPSAWWAYAKLLFGGHRLVRMNGDYLQLGGDILVDPEGVVRLHHVGSGPANRPSVDAMLSVVREVTCAQ